MRGILPIIAVAYAVSALSYGLSEYEEVKRLRLVDEVEYTPVEAVRARWGYGQPFAIDKVYESSDDSGKYYLLICEADLFYLVTKSILGDYIPQLESEGYSVTLLTSSGGDEVDLRDYLAGVYEEKGYFHLLLLGDLPVPFYEMNDWDYEYFPIDLFYMDLDGEWSDVDGDGIWDEHTDGTGDVSADIPVGRIYASSLVYGAHSESGLVSNYLEKNVSYRTGKIPSNGWALLYVDDDWYNDWLEWLDDMYLAYDNITCVYRPEDTFDDDYEGRLDYGYEFVQVCAHSSWIRHRFQRYEDYGYTTFYEVYEIKPESLFYNLFACSAARYVEEDYIGGWYVFMDNDRGLAAVGSTKTGGMLNFGDFYGPLGDGETIGESFRCWMELWADASDLAKLWHYGMTLVGDPTLCVGRYIVTDVVINFGAIQKNDAVVLRWEYGSDGLVAFNLYRDEMPGAGRNARLTSTVKLNEEPIKGYSPLVFVDDGIAPGLTYKYTLETVTDGAGRNSATTEITTDPSDKSVFYLAAPYPNPARSAVNIEYSLPREAADASLEVFDLKGRVVRDFSLEPGSDVVRWDLRDGSGNRVAPGLYTVLFSADGRRTVKKLVVIE
jgi:hypothetical protein